MSSRVTRHIATHGEANIEVYARGSGLRVVMVPSLGRGATDFDEIGAGVAAAGYRVVCPQPRGVGASNGKLDGITLHDYAGDVAAVVKEDGGGPTFIAGHAFGNFVARTFAADYPELTRAIALMAATHVWPLPPDVRDSINKSHQMSLPDDERIRHLQHASFAPGNDPRVWLGGWDEEVMLAERAATEATPRDEWWAAGSAPVLDLQSENDVCTPPVAQPLSRGIWSQQGDDRFDPECRARAASRATGGRRGGARPLYGATSSTELASALCVLTASWTNAPWAGKRALESPADFFAAHSMSLEPGTRTRGAPGDLSRFLNPRGVAIVGASNDLSRIGGQPIRLLSDFGYTGKVYPVNPKYAEIRGLPCYPDVSAVPQPCDVALVALSAPHVPGVIEQCGKAGIPYALVLSAGFSEVGAEGKSLQAQLLAAARSAGVRVVGPNCLGIMNLKDNARVGFGGTLQLTTLKPGPLAMVTQSGGFGFGVVAIACYHGLGFNYAISTGNEADLTLLDWIADLLERPEVEIVVAFMEGITEGRRMMEIGERALQLGKPILVWKVGNTDIGRRAATSHTARMTAGYELFRAAFRRGGYIEIRDVDDLIDISKVLLGRKLPAGNRMAVLTLSGGAGVLLADRCIERGLVLPKLSDTTTAKLRDIMVSFASADNPIDATAHGYNDNFASYSKTIREVLADPNIDQAIARPPRGKAARVWAEGLLEVLRETDKPLVLNWPTSPDDNGDVMRYLEENGVACIMAPGRAVTAMAAVTEFAQKCRAYASTPPRTFRRVTPRADLDLPDAAAILGEHRAKQLLARYGIAVVREKLLSEAEVEALRTAPLAFPLAVKIESADVPHKTEAGAVRLNVTDLPGLKQAAREVVAAARAYRADARIDGVLLQELASGLEVIVGAVNDPYFGPTVAFGLGGIFTELVKDVTHRFAPFDAASAREMIAEIKGAPLLKGYRGQPPLDVEALADALARVSQLIADHADRIAEIDVNPLFVRRAGEGVVAADALIVLKGKS